MCLEWVCNHIEADSFNAKMVYQQGVAERNRIKMAADLVCFQAKARLTTLRIEKQVLSSKLYDTYSLT